MFDYIDSRKSITDKIFGGMFPIGITKNERLLTIVEKRSYRNIIMWLGLILFWGILAYPVLQPLLAIGEIGYIILFLLACLAGIGYAITKILQTPYKRISIFDKDQNLYKIVGVKFLKNEETIGNLDAVKRVNVRVTKYEDSNNNISYTYYAYLQLDDFLAYQDSNMVQLQEEAGQSSSAEIAAVVAGFLKLPAPEETGDVDSNVDGEFMEGLSILK